MKKNILTAIAIGTMVLSTTTALAGASPLKAQDIDVITLDKQVDFNTTHNNVPVGHPFTHNDRTLLPVRVVSENLGYDVEWDQASQTATISKEENIVKIKIGESQALVNGVKTNIDVQDGLPLDTKSQLLESRTYVPVRFVSEALGDNVEYRRPETSSVTNRTVYINSTNLPVEDEEETPEVPETPEFGMPEGAELVKWPGGTGEQHTEFNEYVYDYNIDFKGGGSLEEVILNKIYEDDEVTLTGKDTNGNTWIANATKDVPINFVGLIPVVSKEAHQEIVDLSLVFLEAAANIK